MNLENYRKKFHVLTETKLGSVKPILMEQPQDKLDISNADTTIPPTPSGEKEKGAEFLNQEFEKMMGKPSKNELIKIIKDKLSTMESDDSYDVNKVCMEIANYCNDVMS